MEETLSHDQRREGGMHYTTVKNIHRLIDPLFLNDLKAELDVIVNVSSRVHPARVNRLMKFQDKLAGFRFLDNNPRIWIRKNRDLFESAA